MLLSCHVQVSEKAELIYTLPEHWICKGTSCSKQCKNFTQKLCKNSRILKLPDYIKLLNCMFVRDTLTATQIPVVFKNYFQKAKVQRKP